MKKTVFICTFVLGALSLSAEPAAAELVARAGKGKTLIWNGSEVTNDRSANAFLRTTYRDGWELKG